MTFRSVLRVVLESSYEGAQPLASALWRSVWCGVQEDEEESGRGPTGTVNSGTVSFTFSSSEANSTYTANVKGGTSGAKDLADNELGADRVWSFSTGADTSPASTTHAKRLSTPGLCCGLLFSL
jgi:Bacterial Ig-like domain